MNQVLKTKMSQTIDNLINDLAALRPGRASAELLNDLPVACYGSHMPLAQVAGVAAEDNQLIVQPWDRSNASAVENAIRQSRLGFSVVNEGEKLRLSLPPLSTERRQELVKLAHQKGEAARIQLRQIRAEAIQTANRDKSAGLIREDELSRLEKELNELIGQYNDSVRQAVERKEKELTTI